jgi:hypothetical protein
MYFQSRQYVQNVNKYRSPFPAGDGNHSLVLNIQYLTVYMYVAPSAAALQLADLCHAVA